MPLKTVLNHFIDFRHDVVVKRTQFELNQAEARAHILEGLKIALDNIDAVIELIKASKNPEAAKEGLMNNFNLSEKQAQAILEMRLQRLTGLEVDKILEEYLVEKSEIDQIKKELSSIKKKVGIHLRLGDYLNEEYNGVFHKINYPVYLEKAMSLFEKDYEFIIFSDDFKSLRKLVDLNKFINC